MLDILDQRKIENDLVRSLKKTREEAASGAGGVLHDIIRFPVVKVVERLLNEGADINCRDADTGWTPLYTAVIYGQSDVVELLLGRGADTDILSHAGNTAEEVVVNKEIRDIFLAFKNRKKEGRNERNKS